MKHIHRTFTRQLDQTDCGVACLLSILRYHGGDASRERLRELSGTSIQGTSLLGLYQTAQALGFDAEGLEAEGIHNLSELTEPAILHVLIDDGPTGQRLQHYVIYYGQANGYYTIGDPGRGVVQMPAEELTQIWQSRALLSLKPTDTFVRTTQSRQQQWQWFRQLLHNDLPLLGIAAGLGVLMAALGLTMALFSQKLLDEILPRQNVEKLTLGLLLLAVLLLARAGIGYLRGFLLLRQSRDFNTRIANHFFRDLLQLPKSFFDTRKTGDLVARLNDTRRIQATISFLTGNVVIDVLMVLITAGFLFIYHWQIGLLSLVCLPLFGWLVWRFNARIIAGQQEAMAGYAHTESHFIDCMSGIGVIKANQKEPFFSAVTSAIYTSFQQKLYQLGLLGNRYSLLSELISVGMLVALIAVSTFMVLHKQLKLGEMMAVLNMSGTLISAIARLSTTNIQLQEARVAFQRMREFTELPAEASDSQEVLTNSSLPTEIVLESLTAKGLSYRFAGRPALLKDISFSVQRGQIMGLIGETGSGKSMLLQILQKFYEPEEKDQLSVKMALPGTSFAGGG
ncbi:ATP-binding cassette subfamily B protein [Spirosoma lacussanchae]|uniref:peptidase domain-containing ABC transporter n=1 Tax=Spirosoma lacussanchae TaxID=1884249 RepID=UPI00110824BD|nr:ABC transporter transmembrane domain-containing protein [Spirosoma lacussanchae]